MFSLSRRSTENDTADTAKAVDTYFDTHSVVISSVLNIRKSVLYWNDSYYTRKATTFPQ